MKKLVIIRHAKSSWDDPFLDDHKRPLADRGIHDAPLMAKRLKKEKIFPDVIISSDAERAKATAIITANHLDYPENKIRFSKNLYHANVSQLLSEIKKTEDHVKTLFLVGHNPGLNDLIWKLGGEIDNLPTAGQFGIKFDVKKWENISAKNAEFWFFDYPKKYA
jgi:phosphohistidine phosphatase